MMKKGLAILLAFTLLLSMTALPGMLVFADVDGRVIADIPLKATVSQKTLAASDGGKLIEKGTNFTKTDLSGYDSADLAVEVDVYLEGNLTAFQNGLSAYMRLSSSKQVGKNELYWDLTQYEWKADRWFRLTLPLAEAESRGGAFDATSANYAQISVFSTGGVGQTYVFKAINVRLVDLSLGATGSDPIGDGTFKVGEPEWELIETEYPTTEAVIAGYNFGDYLAPNTDMDATKPLQTLMDALHENGGGTIFIPSGTYTFQGVLNMPEGITIQGDWRAPTAEQPEAVGTIFKVYSGRGNDKATAFITMRPNTCVQGITFWYPEQDAQDIKPYPVTVLMQEKSSWGKEYNHVRNCTFINSYRAVQQGFDGNGCPNVYNVYGTPLYIGLYMDRIADVGRFDYISFAPFYWENCGLAGAPAAGEAKEALETYLAENATAFMAGRTDWSYWSFSEVTGYQTGLRFVESPGEAEAGNPYLYSNGHVYGLTFTDCGVGIRFDGISSGAGEVFSNITFRQCKTGILTVVNPGEMGNLHMNHITIDADTAIEHGGNIRLFLNDATIQRGEVILNGGPFTISGSTFETAAPQVKVTAGASCGILQGNTATNGEFTVDNQCMCPLEVSSQPVEMDEIDWMTADQSVDETVKAAREVLYVADLDKTGTKDVTAALQTLLNKAGQEGGGYVFLPGGYYRLNGSVTVPTGVELCGAVDLGRNLYKIGTIFRIYGTQKDATVILSEGSGLRAVVFDYPAQGNTITTLKSYPYTVQGRGADVYIVNISIRNGYDGIDLMTYRCDNHYVKYLAGFCFHSVIRVGGGAVGGKIINYQMNSTAWWNGDESKHGTWDNCPSGLEKEDGGGAQQLRDVYVQSYCDILTVGDVTDQVLYNNFSYLGAIGAHYIKEDGKGASGWNVGNAYDYSTVGIQIDGIGDMDFINPQIVSYNYNNIEKSRHMIYLTDKCTDKVNVINVTCWAKPQSCMRVDGGELNVYCASFTDSTESKKFVELSGDGRLNLQNGTVTNSNVTGLVGGNTANLSMSGYINEREMSGQSDCRWGVNMVRVARWDVPTNATIDTTQKMAFTEAFTNYVTTTGAGDLQNVVPSQGGSFGASNAIDSSHVTIEQQDGNAMMCLYHNGKASAAYARARDLRLAAGQENCRYMLETRMNLKQLRQNEGSIASIIIYDFIGTTTRNATQLVQFTTDGVYVDGAKLADYDLDTWYRVQVDFDLNDCNNKTYTVRLLDDDYTEIAKSAAIRFVDSYQGTQNPLGVLDFTARATTDQTDTATEWLVDYVFITQDPTEVTSTVVWGDGNGDGKVTTADAAVVLQYAAELLGAGGIQLAASDVNGDGKVTTADAALILQKCAELLERFPVEGK